MHLMCAVVVSKQQQRISLVCLLSTTPSLRLNRWAFQRAEGAEHAAVAWIRAQQILAVAAFVEVQTGICGHGFLPGETTVRAGQHGLKNKGTHGTSLLHGGGVARVHCRRGERFARGLVWVEGHSGRFLVEIDSDRIYPWYLL